MVDGERALLGLHDRKLVLLGECDLDVAGQRQVADRADGLALLMESIKIDA